MDSENTLPTISVVIPCFNAEATLVPVLEALKNAVPPPLEILVVDDASNDRSHEIISESRVKMIEFETHRGVAAARNFGAEASSGEILCFVDADIVVPPDFVSQILGYFEHHPESVALSASINPDIPKSGFFSEYLNLRLHFGFRHLGHAVTTLCTSCAAIKKDVFWAVSGFDISATCAVNDEAVLGWRLAENGLQTSFPRSFLVVHLKTMRLTDWVKKFWNEGRQWVLIAFRHRGTSRKPVRRTLNYRRPANVLVLISLLISMVMVPVSHTLTLLIVTGLAFALVNSNYVFFMVKSRSVLWLPGVLAMVLLETAFHALGMVSGLVFAARR